MKNIEKLTKTAYEQQIDALMDTYALENDTELSEQTINKLVYATNTSNFSKSFTLKHKFFNVLINLFYFSLKVIFLVVSTPIISVSSVLLFLFFESTDTKKDVHFTKGFLIDIRDYLLSFCEFDNVFINNTKSIFLLLLFSPLILPIQICKYIYKITILPLALIIIPLQKIDEFANTLPNYLYIHDSNIDLEIIESEYIQINNAPEQVSTNIDISLLDQNVTSGNSINHVYDQIREREKQEKLFKMPKDSTTDTQISLNLKESLLI